ncbi:hypothetical protein [Helicobacter suis]|uniref:hypothetical protein n=1 Tax=Helicobacter suis TaxID=104628 RepID=UPI001596B7A9|nr:hypothetical protein [Helicobacter suis]BCD49611.1 hypothetical protein NHP194004_10580 [Helicobacter suis]
MIKLEDYTKYLNWFVRVTLINDQVIYEGTTIEGPFDGYDFAACSGDEGGDSLTIDMYGWGYDLYVSDIEKIEPLHKASKETLQAYHKINYPTTPLD